MVNTEDNLKCMSLESQMNNVIRSRTIRNIHSVVIGVDVQLKVLKYRNECGMLFNVAHKEDHVPNVKL